MNKNDRHQQQGRQRDDRHRQSSQDFGRQGREDESYRYSSSEGDDLPQVPSRGQQGQAASQPGFRDQYSRQPQGQERWQEGAWRQGEYAQGFGHGTQGYGGQPSQGIRDPYPGASGYGGYGAGAYGNQRDDFLAQRRGAQYAGPEFSASRYGSSGFEPSPYMGSQGGYPGSGYQGSYQGLPSGSLGGYSAQQGGYGGSYQGVYGGSADEYGRQAFGSSYGQASGYGASAGQSEFQGHRGKGPKGYTRSDDRIKEDICERLSDDPMIDASDVSVDARQGVVTLTGSVESRQLKHRIEDLIERCSGVRDIENRLTVKSSSAGQGASRNASSASGGASATSSATGSSQGSTGTPGSRPS